MVQQKIIIAAGSIAEDARQFLEQQGAAIEDLVGLSLIELPTDAVSIKEDQADQYMIALWAADEELEEDTLIVDLALNACETRVTLHKDYWTSPQAQVRPVR